MKRFFLAFSFACMLPMAHATTPPAPTAAFEPFVLEPNQRTEYSNLSFQQIHASCVINTAAKEGNDIFVEVLRKKGQVNGKNLSTGDHVMLHFYDNDLLDVVADAAGRVALTNNGPTTVKATCHTF